MCTQDYKSRRNEIWLKIYVKLLVKVRKLLNKGIKARISPPSEAVIYYFYIGILSDRDETP